MSSWQQQLKEAIKTPPELHQFFQKNYPKQFEALNHKKLPYKVFIPQALAHQIADQGIDGALWKQFIPSQEELATGGLYDPIGDINHSPTNKLIHRYQNRVLLTPTAHCPVDCRYCFRKNELNQKEELFSGGLLNALDYIKEHPEIEEVILTGGDPLVMSNRKLQELCLKISEISHIKYLRFHSRTPIIIPERLDDEFIEFIQLLESKFKKVVLVIHANHATELSSKLTERVLALREKTKLLLLSQSVLLKGVNDSVEDLCSLMNSLTEIGVLPYYLHHPDQVQGAMHFYMPIDQGRRLYRQLQQRLPGWSIPRYIVDIPGGHGKVPASNGETDSFSGQLIDAKGELRPYK